MTKTLIEELNNKYCDKNIILLFDNNISTTKLYNDIRVKCYNVLRINNISNIDMLNISTCDVIITDIKTYDQIKYIYNINYFIVQNNVNIFPNDYNTVQYNCISLQYVNSILEKPFKLDQQSYDDKLQQLEFNDNLSIDIKQTIYIIIPTYNQEKYTIKCFNSINKFYDDKYNIHIVWVDNGSSTDSKTIVEKCIDKLTKFNNTNFHKIIFEQQLGFVKSTNKGIEFALSQNADYIILQNNDTIVTKNWLNPLIMSIKNGVIGAGPITNSLLSRQGFDKVRKSVLPDLPDFCNKSIANITDTLHSMYKDKNIILNNDTDVDISIAFYCTVFDSSVFKTVGLLDESFGLGYGDDVDFCQRLFLAGYKLAFVPESYVLHNHRTTFNSIYTEQQIKNIISARILQCKIRNSFNVVKNKKIAVYTCIIGNYDKLLSYQNVDIKNCDYFCFTDTPIKNHASYWNIININPFKKYISNLINCEHEEELNTKLARYIKINPHLFFPNYQFSVWVDGNINIIGNVLNLIDEIKQQNCSILIPKHPLRNCIYEEIEACRKLNKDTDKHLDYVKKQLTLENYPVYNGLVQSGFIIRNHNDKHCIEVMNVWWDYIKKWSKRDQLSFNYVIWKLKYMYLTIPWDKLLNKYILLIKHNK